MDHFPVIPTIIIIALLMTVVALILPDTGMEKCQQIQSHNTCFSALNR